MKTRQNGMAMLEILAAIAVGTTLFIGLSSLIDISLEDARGQQAAHHQAQLAEAAKNYMAAHYATLLNETAGGAVASIEFSDLQPEFLPAGFVDQNSYRQNTCALVRQDTGKLHALVVSYGGMPIPDRSIAAVAMKAGPGAGYINSVDTGTARGPSWSLDTTPYRAGTCAGGARPLTGNASDAGHLVTNLFYAGPGQLATDFLYRDPVPGRPDLNQMNTPLLMAGAALVNLGDPCPSAAIAIENTTRDVVVCDGGSWRYSSSSWRPPVANYNALLALAAPRGGEVRVTRDTGRAFVYNDNSNTWEALAIDHNGNLNVPGSLAAGALHVSGAAAVQGLLSAQGDAAVAGRLTVGQTLTALENIDAKGNMSIDGGIQAGGHIHAKKEMRADWMATIGIVLDGISTPGAECNLLIGNVRHNPVGTMMRDLNGMLVNCITANVFTYANGSLTP